MNGGRPGCLCTTCLAGWFDALTRLQELAATPALSGTELMPQAAVLLPAGLAYVGLVTLLGGRELSLLLSTLKGGGES